MLQSLNYFTYQERHFSIKYNNFDICLKVFQLRRQILLPTKYSIPYCIIKVLLILDIESNIFHLAITICLKIQEHLLYYLLHYLKWSSNVKNVFLYNGQITQSNKVIFLHCLKVILLHENVNQKFRRKEKCRWYVPHIFFLESTTTLHAQWTSRNTHMIRSCAK